jgi:hypothetical protein
LGWYAPPPWGGRSDVLLGYEACQSGENVPNHFPAGSRILNWETLNRKVVELFHAGQYDRSVVVAKDALGLAERSFGPDHQNVATSLSNLATLYRETKRPEEAGKLEARAKGIREIER